MSEYFSPLTTRVDERPMFNGGLRTSPIDKIIIHHNATTNPQVALNTWTIDAGNYTSAHYEITDDEIIGAVGENYIAYHAGGTGGNDVPKISNPNGRSIGLEHVNNTGAPNWTVSDATLHQSARLIADICKRYGLPINRGTIMLHREVTSTTCPGGLDINKLVAYAQAEGQGGQPNPAILEDKDMLLFKADIDTKYGKADTVFFQTGNSIVAVDPGTTFGDLKSKGIPFVTMTKRNVEGIINRAGGIG